MLAVRMSFANNKYADNLKEVFFLLCLSGSSVVPGLQVGIRELQAAGLSTRGRQRVLGYNYQQEVTV